MRVAAIDIGTNSVLLLVAEARGRELSPVLERATITRLGQGVDASRVLAPAAIDRTLACLEGYAADIRRERVDRIDVVGTSAMRDAKGGSAFIERARAILGVAPRVVSGEEEARLTFAGALSGLGVAPDRAVVVDIGGGSTEIIAGGEGVSLDVGSVRLTERHQTSDPPSERDQRAMREDMRRALATAHSGPQAVRPGTQLGKTVVGVAGTVTTIAAHALSIAPYDGARVHGAKLSLADVVAAREGLAGMTLEARKKLATVSPGRADVIVAGAIVLEEVMAFLQATSVVVSDRGVRWGLASDLAASAGVI